MLLLPLRAAQPGLALPELPWRQKANQGLFLAAQEAVTQPMSRPQGGPVGHGQGHLQNSACPKG